MVVWKINNCIFLVIIARREHSSGELAIIRTEAVRDYCLKLLKEQCKDRIIRQSIAAEKHRRQVKPETTKLGRQPGAGAPARRAGAHLCCPNTRYKKLCWSYYLTVNLSPLEIFSVSEESAKKKTVILTMQQNLPSNCVHPYEGRPPVRSRWHSFP